MGRKSRKNAKLQNESLNKAKKDVKNSSNGSVTQGAGYAEIIKQNASFEKFYKAQKIVPEEEWALFMDTMRQSLPSTFRITGNKSLAKALLKIIESDYLAKLTSGTTGQCDFEMFSLPWYPDKLAWQLNISRKDIRKTEAYERLHNFLISETDSGNISRQEAVSMIPPLVLDVQSHHKVLDMCAAPGSKTAQLIEMLHSDDRTVPDGVIIANDADNKRCYMLVHQAKRLQSPCLLITNHDAGAMPNIATFESQMLKYDRILCDVPCSGDGTIRKNVDIWVKWNVANCLNYHYIQSRILKRGLELLELGGKLVYSTCSLCPLEDESVIHHILQLSKGSVELVEVGDQLPGLKYVPGLSYWKVTNRELEEIVNPEAIPDKNKNQIKESMFPPSPEDAPKYNLHRCLRILPHHQNTGGFFVAVLRKNALLPWENPKHDNGQNSDSPIRPPPKKKQKKMSGYREDPFVYFQNDEKLWPSLCSAYKISSDFDHTLLLTRCREGKKRTIYFTSKLIKEIITCNEEKLKIINTGIKLFCRCDNKKSSPTEFRLTQEGLLTVLSYLRYRVVSVGKPDIIYLLSSNFPELSKLSTATTQALESYENGSLALICEEEHEDKSIGKLLMGLCAWKGAMSLRAYVPKNEKLHYLRLCGVDTFQFERKKFKLADDAADNPQDSLTNENEESAKNIISDLCPLQTESVSSLITEQCAEIEEV